MQAATHVVYKLSRIGMLKTPLISHIGDLGPWLQLQTSDHTVAPRYSECCTRQTMPTHHSNYPAWQKPSQGRIHRC